ncbi:sugar transporter ERD6-like 6 [Lathyrus oleraceus]|nr:sugar transporter ERD6-like 6 [Pisum sativum]
MDDAYELVPPTDIDVVELMSTSDDEATEHVESKPFGGGHVELSLLPLYPYYIVRHIWDREVLATILTLWLADESGRRLLLIVSSSAMALSLLVVSISFYLKEYISPDSDLYATLSLVSVAGVVVMVIAFSLGLGAMPWIIMSEILPINIKGLAGSFATLANWFFSWLVTLTANLLLDWSSGGTFTIYTAVCVFTAGFVAIWVPETKGKTLDEIQQFFR